MFNPVMQNVNKFLNLTSKFSNLPLFRVVLKVSFELLFMFVFTALGTILVLL
jgi:hypothetical protein